MEKQNGKVDSPEAIFRVGERSSTASLAAAATNTPWSSVARGGGESSFPAKKRKARKNAHWHCYNSDESTSTATANNPLQQQLPDPAIQNQNQPIFTPLGGMHNTVMVGVNFMVDTITINTGEDIVTKLVSFSLEFGAMRVTMVLSATGFVSTATLSQPSFQGILTFQGEWTILSLTGVFTVNECGDHDYGVSMSRLPNPHHPRLNGNLTVSLGAFDARGGVLLGSVVGSLTAASPIQVIIGTFEKGTYRPPPPQHQSNGTAPTPIIAQPRVPFQPDRNTTPFQKNPYGRIR